MVVTDDHVNGNDQSGVGGDCGSVGGVATIAVMILLLV